MLNNMNEKALSPFLDLVKQAQNVPALTISIDWLKMFGSCSLDRWSLDDIKSDRNAVVAWDETGEMRVEFQRIGTTNFHSFYKVYWYGELVARVEAHPKAEKIMKDPYACTVQIENHCFYDGSWYDVLEMLTDVILFTPKSISRLDIAIDGMNWWCTFMNMYQRQQRARAPIDKVDKKSKLSSFDFNDRLKEYGRFTMGSAASDKQLSIYDKVREIETSNKKYIQRYWEKNGLTVGGSVYRFEIRIKSAYMKKIVGFNFLDLRDKGVLASIMQVCVKKFCEFAMVQRSANITRWPRLDLIPWEKLGAFPLDRATKPQINDRYKAKMQVHIAYKDLMLDRIPDHIKEPTIAAARAHLERFDLHEWYDRVSERWYREYSRLRPDSSSPADEISLI